MSSGHVFGPANPEGSPLEKAITALTEGPLWKLEQDILNSGLDREVARRLAQAFKTYKLEHYYDKLRNYQELEYWANRHTHFISTVPEPVAGCNIETAVYEATLNISVDTLNPVGVVFSPDGTMMFITEQQYDRIYRYDLTVAWDITSAILISNIDISAQEALPRGIAFKPDGTAFYSVGDTLLVREFNLSVPWDITTAVLGNSYDISSFSDPQSIAFNPDGTIFYVLKSYVNLIERYDLTVAWDITTASLINSFDVSTEETYPTGMTINSSGTSIFIVGRDNDFVHRYDLNTPWDITTAILHSSFSVLTEEGYAQGLAFTPDCSKMFITGIGSDSVHSYSLS